MHTVDASLVENLLIGKLGGDSIGIYDEYGSNNVDLILRGNTVTSFRYGVIAFLDNMRTFTRNNVVDIGIAPLYYDQLAANLTRMTRNFWDDGGEPDLSNSLWVQLTYQQGRLEFSPAGKANPVKFKAIYP